MWCCFAAGVKMSNQWGIDTGMSTALHFQRGVSNAIGGAQQVANGLFDVIGLTPLASCNHQVRIQGIVMFAQLPQVHVMHGADPIHGGNPVEQLRQVQVRWAAEHQHAYHAAYFH